MSVQDAKLFVKKLTEDREFAERFGRAQGMDAKMRVATESGLVFTPEEAQLAAGELSDAEMEKVAGGFDDGPFAFFR